jgi:hypothetical protein
MNSGKPRSAIQKFADGFVAVIGFLMKVLLIVLAVICCPILFLIVIILMISIIAAVAVLFGGSMVLINAIPFQPVVDWINYFGDLGSPILALLASTSAALLVGIPLFALVFMGLRALFNWKAMYSGMRVTLLILWFISLICLIVLGSIGIMMQ